MTSRVSETRTQGDTTATEPDIPPVLQSSDLGRNEAPATPLRTRRHRKNKGGLILLMLVVAAIALLVWYIFIRRPALQGAENLVVAPDGSPAMKQLSRPRLPDASARFASAKGTLCEVAM